MLRQQRRTSECKKSLNANPAYNCQVRAASRNMNQCDGNGVGRKTSNLTECDTLQDFEMEDATNRNTVCNPEENHVPSAIQDALYTFIHHRTFDNAISQKTLSIPGIDRLSYHHKHLLYFFEHEAIANIACTASDKAEFCHFFMPMALNHQHVLVALLCIASMYRVSVGLDQTEEETIKLRIITIKQINESLGIGDNASITAALAATIILALGEIMLPRGNQNWEVYLRGANAILNTLGCSNGIEIEFLRRASRSLRLITASTSRLKYSGEIEGRLQTNYISETAGHSVLLGPVLEDIREFCEEHDANPTAIHNMQSSLYAKYIRLYDRIQVLFFLRSYRFQTWAPATTEEKRNLWLLDEAFHYTALLRLHACKHTAKTPLSRAIKTSVGRIVKCLGDMDFSKKPNSAISTYYPLLEASKHATVPADRVMLIKIAQKVQASCSILYFAKMLQDATAKWDHSL